MKFNSPLVGVALATALASTTGYCVLTNMPASERPASPVQTPATPIYPEAIIPYPLEDLPSVSDAK